MWKWINKKLGCSEEQAQFDHVQFEIELRKLEVKDGDNILIKYSHPLTELSAKNIRSAIKKAMESIGVNVHGVIIDNGMDMEIIRTETESPNSKPNQKDRFISNLQAIIKDFETETGAEIHKINIVRFEDSIVGIITPKTKIVHLSFEMK